MQEFSVSSERERYGASWLRGAELPVRPQSKQRDFQNSQEIADWSL